jgi:cobyrinic acid a,c-diamide synthase
MSGIVIAGTHSGCGKTTITLGVLAALKKKGMAVQSFKAGPDFIDTGLHRMITGRPSRNLDLWMCGEDYVKACFHKYSTGVDISVVEGVMGLYDGDFSTARLADALNLSVILIVDAYGMAESAGAIVKGFSNPPLPPFVKGGMGGFIAGVIFNRVSSERHYERLKNSVCGIPVLGYLPRDLNFEIPHRHLGLAVAEENPIAGEDIERLADAVLKHVDVENIIQLSHTDGFPSFPLVGNLSFSEGLRTSHNDKIHSPVHPFTHSPRIAVAYDKAFCFYYEDNLDLLKDAGAEIIKFSPLYNQAIPEADAVYIGGGYPELYAGELSKNQSMLEAIHNWADSGKPMYAECGGLMYLSKGIHDCDGNFFKLAGVFPFETAMRKGRSHLGYREIQLNDDCIHGKKGDKLRGHEFHYSSIVQQSNRATVKEYHNLAYALRNNNGECLSDEGYRYKNTLASYIHIHFGSNINTAKVFIGFIASVQNKAQNKAYGTISEAKSRFTSTQRESKRKLGETI